MRRIRMDTCGPASGSSSARTGSVPGRSRQIHGAHDLIGLGLDPLPQFVHQRHASHRQQRQRIQHQRRHHRGGVGRRQPRPNGPHDRAPLRYARIM